MTEAEPWDAHRFLQQLAHKGRHDLGGPIRAVRSFSDMLREELGDGLAGDPATYLDFVTAAGERLDLMVRRITELIRVDETSVTLSSVNLEGVQLNSPRVDLVFQPQVMPSVHADERLLRIVFNEVLTNASQYGSEPISITQSSASTWLVSDAGEGIPPHHLTDALQPFRRLVPNSHSPGVGLGLPLAARCMELMGGQLALIDPEPGCGLGVRLSFAEAVTPSQAATSQL